MLHLDPISLSTTVSLLNEYCSLVPLFMLHIFVTFPPVEE